MQKTPNGLHQVYETNIGKVVIDDHFQVFVDGEHRHRVQVGQHTMQHHTPLHARDGMMVELLLDSLIEFLNGNQQYGRVDEHLCTLVATIQQVALLECLTQVRSQRDAAFHDIRFIYHLVHSRRVAHGEGKRVATDTYVQPHTLVHGFVI